LLRLARAIAPGRTEQKRKNSPTPQLNEVNQSEKYFLKTSRLGFRQWREADLSIAIGLWGDYEVTKYFDGRGKLSRDEYYPPTGLNHRSYLLKANEYPGSRQA